MSATGNSAPNSDHSTAISRSTTDTVDTTSTATTTGDQQQSKRFRGTYNKGITYCDPGEERRHKLTGWVDSDFAADRDTRKSMTGYLFSLNDGAVSWRSSQQGGVTLSSAEAEFVAASQQFRQVGATEIWEDNASCDMMSENPANRERTRHVDTRVHYLRELGRDGHVKLLKCAGPQNVTDALTKSLPRPVLAKHRNTCGAHAFLSQPFISLSRLDGPRRRPIISSHHAHIKSHALPEKYFLGG